MNIFPHAISQELAINIFYNWLTEAEIGLDTLIGKCWYMYIER